jgi:hypothetical protein
MRRSEVGRRATAFRHAGIGGMAGFADPAYRFSFPLTKNRLVPPSPDESTAVRAVREMRRALDIPEA